MSQLNKSKIILLVIGIIILVVTIVSLFFVYRIDHEKNYNTLINELIIYSNNQEFSTVGRGLDEQGRQDFLAHEVLPSFIQIADRAEGIDCKHLPPETLQECEEVTSIVKFMAAYYQKLIDLSDLYTYQELQNSKVKDQDQEKLNYINQNQSRLNQDQNRLKQLIQ